MVQGQKLKGGDYEKLSYFLQYFYLHFYLYFYFYGCFTVAGGNRGSRGVKPSALVR